MWISKIKNKTDLCIAFIVLVVGIFFVQSVLVRGPWIVPTFMEYRNDYQVHQGVTAFHLGIINNWLKEGAVHLRFGLYMYPASVEMPTLADRNFYGSYPPGLHLPVFLLFKMLDMTGIVPDIHNQRDTQLLLVIAYNYLLHFILALVMCCLAFFVCLKLGFSRFNSILLALIPAVVQFRNASSLYHYHLYYNVNSAVLLPFALYALLEFLRTSYTSPRILPMVRLGQPLIMFWGVLTDWLFVPVILTVYAIRCINKDIALPVPLSRATTWLKQSLLFFAPAFIAIALWVSQIAHYLFNVVHGGLTTAEVSSQRLTFFDNLLYRMGIDADSHHYLSHLQAAFITHIKNSFELTGVIILALTFLLATATLVLLRKNNNIKQAATTYLIFFVPCIIYHLFFLQYSYDHMFAPLKFSLALSLTFMLLPVFILQIILQNHLLPVARRAYVKHISWVAVIGLGTSLLYGYVRIGKEAQVTKMFAAPDYRYVDIGNFVQQHTTYQDVVFSNSYYVPNSFNTMSVYFTGKVIHKAKSAEDIYKKTKMITDDFTINFLYLKHKQTKADRLADLLTSHQLVVYEVQHNKSAGMWSVDGQEFNAWYARSRGKL